MKISLRDKATIVMAFAAVFLCGYGIGHLVRDRQIPPTPASSDTTTTVTWEKETLSLLRETLDLRPSQVEQVERELSRTAEEIDQSHHAVLLEYHLHLSKLYERLINLLDQSQADRLREEKRLLDRQIENMSIYE